VADSILIIDASGEGAEPVTRPPTPEEQAQLDADRASGHAHRVAQTQAASDDAERLRTINERARTDPAYKALADIVLRGLSR
jgi:hypothetical protein